MACRRCSRVWPMGQARCDRCGSKLVSRDTRSLQKVWAWWIAGVIAYIPANIYPMLVTNTLVYRSENTIVGGAVEVAHHGAYGVAAIILIASVLIPVGKFLAIAFLAITAQRGTSVTPRARTHLFEIVEFIGRWSMIDVFVVAILSSLVQLSVVASIRPGPAALTFAISVICTMLSAQSFDSRLIWDAVSRQQPRKTP
ncbi:paraquat-inducible protein A [Photobacterium sp. TY 1-4]|uniref:Paraquat-inducible protein A n=1 Tax=Pseudosulfitobacter koreensis TaxID=2968472 RepID=A0ABT1Z458_9RHOB|nr:paraquat-inducible protein A [Pseudosulfitobacter koreense]